MPIEITMPRLSDTMEEGTLVKWRVQVGDKIETGDHLADVETDKATMELQAFDDGTVAQLAIKEGSTVPVGNLILVLAEAGESIEDASTTTAVLQIADPEKATTVPTTRASVLPRSTANSDRKTVTKSRIRISPVARKIADEQGLDLSTITGSGPDGRIIKRDVLALASGPAPKAPATSIDATPEPSLEPTMLEEKTIELSNMRKTIAKRLVESKSTIPHFTVSALINMDSLLELRLTLNNQLKIQDIKLSVNDFVTRAAALAATVHPTINSSWNHETIIQHGTIHVGLAVALSEDQGGGLVVPVLRDVQNKGLRTISLETRDLATKARQRNLSLEEMEGGTLTISNLGMFGIEQFTAIINPPQAAILAVGAALAKPVVRNEKITIGHEMIVTLCCDHRVLDGAVAAQYLQTLKRLLENPAALLV